jgi:hypothetical protein
MEMPLIYSAVVRKKIRKNGPFDISTITPDYPLLAHLLANIVRQISELPDFSDDKKIAVLSDFGGEHPSAHFNTYSFLFLAYNKVGPFADKVDALRQKHNLLDPYSEFAYKRLRSGARSRALPEFLQLIDSFIHGAIVTIAIDKRIDTVFGPSKQQTHPVISAHLVTRGLGQWSGYAAEKVLRACHMIGLFASLLTTDQQRLLWYCDNDLINDDSSAREFSHTREIFIRVVSLYVRRGFEVLGFAKAFEKKSHLDDLLSVPDLAAGVVQDVLQSQKTGERIPGGVEKIALMKWIATSATFLSKITAQIGLMDDGTIGSGIVDFTRAK